MLIVGLGSIYPTLNINIYLQFQYYFEKKSLKTAVVTIENRFFKCPLRLLTTFARRFMEMYVVCSTFLSFCTLSMAFSSLTIPWNIYIFQI